MRILLVGALILLVAMAKDAKAASAVDGLILHLDAAAQVKEGGAGASNSVWRNLAGQPDAIAGSGALHNFAGDSVSGWVGSGTTGDPHALRFDGKHTYVLGPGNLEIPEITIEAWARVDGVGGQTMRGATLIGNDFGMGGVALMVAPMSGSPLVLHQVTFTPVDAETPAHVWQQVVVTMKDGTARVYVNGAFGSSLPAPRDLQTGHPPYYQLGAARHTDFDFAEADGLIGSIAIVRVYNRALWPDEIKANFEADKGRFSLQSAPASLAPVSSMPIPKVPGLGPVPPARCVKWDYYNHPVRVGASGAPAAPSAWYPNWPYGPRWAFDGYPTSLAQPYVRNYWRTEAFTPDKPATLVIDYRRPVAVTRFVHYFNTFRAPFAWKDVEIYSSADKETWALKQSFANLPSDAPQVLGIDAPSPARFYKIVVKAMAEGATHIETHEIETYYGATIGSVECKRAVQSEPVTLRVRVLSHDVDLKDALVRVDTGMFGEGPSAKIALVPKDKGAVTEIKLVPTRSGPMPLFLELRAGGSVIDRRPFTLPIHPKLALRDLSPSGAVTAKAGEHVSVSGTAANEGATPARDVRIRWLGGSVSLGAMKPGESRPFRVQAKAPPGYTQGDIKVTAEGLAATTIRRAVICPTGGGFTFDAPGARTTWQVRIGEAGITAQTPDRAAVNAKLSLFAGGKPIALSSVGSDKVARLVAAAPGAVVTIVPGTQGIAGDLSLQFSAFRDVSNPINPSWLDLELRLAVEKPKIMFRPHIDWYTVEHGPNYPHLANGHNSATRMLCIQTDKGTVSMVPDTDNITWGFTKDNEMTMQLQIPLAPNQPGRWRPIWEAPMEFSIVLPVRRGDWWDAYQHVVKDVFEFEQPKQWAMPLTQMQMLNARYVMRYEVWSEKWQTVRSHPWFDFFYNFYGTTYTLPTLYSWYLVTDDRQARVKSEKVVDWLLSVQEKNGPWFSQYCVEGSPPQLVGRDQAWNRWVMPHSTATAAKTLLWYWEASGRTDGRVFDAAKRGCDWLLTTQRPDGGWPYAFDLEGKAVTDLPDAGQIWCTWALWKMHEYTGEAEYREAAVRSRDFFKKTFMDLHRYMGYWEDVSGAAGKVARSWEGYEPAIAALVFADMGDRQLAVEAAKDAATWSWTRVISTRQYETCYGETTEQSVCGPSQAQSPMTGIGMQQVYELTGDKLWSDFAGATKAVNFCADPDQAYGMVATGGWDDPLTGVVGPPYDNVRPWVTPDNSRGDEYGRQVWNEWCTAQFAWLALEWLVREGNVRAPQYVKIDPDTYRGTVLGEPGRVKMPEEKCDVNGIEHHDIDWVGYQNDAKYVLLVMNHKEKLTVAIRPHEAHLDVYCRPPRILVSSGRSYKEGPPVNAGEQYMLEIPKGGTALLVWDRIK